MIQVILIAFLFVESVDSSSSLCACTTSNTNVYFNQTINSSTLTRLLPGDCVTLLEKGTEWIKVSVNNRVGFVTASGVSKKQCSVEQTKAAKQNLKRFLDHVDRDNACMQEHCLKCSCHTGGDHCGDCSICHKHHQENEQICHEWLNKVDGAWSDWSSWQFCTATCGGGVQMRTRKCDNPPKATVFGKDCEGDDRQQQSCNTQHCPIDGVWSSWSAYSICTATCGTGYMSKTRTCTSPKPQYNGKQCTGPAVETVPCNTDHCPVDGGWSAFGAYSVCSKSCGGGTMYRQRTCTNPTPAYHGALCSGSNLDIQPCNVNNCPIDGFWNDWSQWTNCDVSCGGGRRSRQRTCTNPMYGGKDCVGVNHQEEVCSTMHCPIDGGWTSWGSYTGCSVGCGSQSQGFQYSQRFCTNPTPQYNGQDCVGDKFRYVPCYPVCSTPAAQTQMPVTNIATTPTTRSTTTQTIKPTTVQTAAPTNNPTVSTASPTNNQQASSFKTCDKLGVVRVLGNNLKVTHSLSSKCSDNTYAAPEALLMEFCSMGRTTTWHQNMKVTDACANNLLTTQYVPVASYQNSVLSKYSGIFMGCVNGGFKIAMQLCGHPAGLFHIYNSSVTNGLLDPNNYYIVT